MKYDIDGHLWWAPMKKIGGGWIAFKDGSANPSSPSSASTLGSKQTASLGQLQSQLQGTGVGAGASPNPLAQSSQISMNNPANGVSGGYTGGGTPQPASMTPGFQLETPGFNYGPSNPIPQGSGAMGGAQQMMPGAVPAGGIGGSNGNAPPTAPTAPWTPPPGMNFGQYANSIGLGANDKPMDGSWDNFRQSNVNDYNTLINGPAMRGSGLQPQAFTPGSYGSAQQMMPGAAPSGGMGRPMQRQIAPAPQPTYGGYPMGGPMGNPQGGNPALGPDRMPTTAGAQPGQMQAMVAALRNMPASTAAQGPQVLPPNVQPRNPMQAGRGGFVRNGMQ